MKNLALTFSFLLWAGIHANAQSVTIDPRANTTPIVTIQSSSEGLLLPTNSNPAVNITSPPNGTMIYNSSTNTPNFYNGTQWQSVTASTAASMGFTRMICFYDYNTIWTVPAGVNKIIIESWDEGWPGQCYYYNGGPNGSAGKAGDYRYGIYEVLPNQELIINIDVPGSKVYSLNPYKIFSFSPETKVIEGGKGGQIKITYGMPAAGKYHTVFNMGDGGDAFNGGRGGKGGSWINENEIFKYKIPTGDNAYGSFPGGGGGAGYCSDPTQSIYAVGGRGLVIIYY